VRIAEITALKVDGSWRNWVFVRVVTDTGIVGYGEASLEGREHAVAGAVQDMSRRLIGADARRIRSVVDVVTREGYWPAGPVISSALAGIETALWDIAGKRLGAPLHELLGGAVRDRLETYSNAWYFGASTADDFGARAAAVVDQGWRALKFDPFGTAGLTISPSQLGAAVERVAAVREAVGPDVRILVEGHGRFSIHSAATVARALEPYDPAIFEEPLPPGDASVLRRLAGAVRVPLAAGERLYSAAECGHFSREAGICVLQPDVIHVGGVSALVAACEAAYAAGVVVAPHNASGPIATAATLHVSAVMPNLFLQEMFSPQDAPWKDQVARPPIVVEDGEVRVPDGPGLGIDLDDLECELHPFEPRDLRMFDDESILSHPVDGTVANVEVRADD
jgi:galactonate dehydratase